MGEVDKVSLIGQIGEILGMLKPIPDQLQLLFDKVEREVRERMETDNKIQLDLRSVTESLERIKADLENHEASQRVQEDVVRVLKLIGGSSETLSELNGKVEGLEESVAELSAARKSAKVVLKSLGGHLLSIVIALLIAYLVFKFGWTP